MTQVKKSNRKRGENNSTNNKDRENIMITNFFHFFFKYKRGELCITCDGLVNFRTPVRTLTSKKITGESYAQILVFFDSVTVT